MKALKNAHTPNVKFGMGDYYGSGIKNKIGKMREGSVGMAYITPKKLGKPPKKVA